MKIIATCGEKEIKKLSMFDTRMVDILELRLDLVSGKFLQKKIHDFLEVWNKPIIFTYRQAEDSNQKKSYAHDRKALDTLLQFYNSSQHFIDIEMDQKQPALKAYESERFRLICSYHDFHGILSLKKMKNYIEKSLNEIKESKEVLFKFAVSPQNAKQLAKFLEYSRELAHFHQIIAIAMGELGVMTRIFPDTYASGYTYCTLSKAKAPGQMTVETLQRIRKIGS
ncbi:MAG: type I 3-dehydroquinate dehydratase [Spirochaetota bacterium]